MCIKKRGITLVILILINLSTLTYSEVSKDSFFTIGSEFLIIKNPNSPNPLQTQIIIIYPNTNIFIDINNDGVDDYHLNYEHKGQYTLSTIWQITEGSRITSDKPIYYYQTIFSYNNYSLVPNFINSDKIFIIPSVDNYRKEYYIINGSYRFLSKENTIIYIDENIDGTIDKQVYTKNFTTINLNNFSRVFSNNTFFGYSNDSITSPIGTDFFTSTDKMQLIISINNTKLDFDFNMDTNIDNSYTLNKGVYNFTVIPGTRIISTNNISCFDYYNYITQTADLTKYTKLFSPCKRTSDISNEFFIYVTKKNHSLIGLFNNESYNSQNYSVTLTSLNSEEIVIDNLTSNNKKNIDVSFYSVNAITPIIDSLEYKESSGASPSIIYNYSAGSLIAYKKPYLITKSKSKIITPNSTMILSVRLFNPQSTNSLENIEIYIPLSCGLLIKQGIANYKKESLNIGLIEENSKVLIEDNINNQIIFRYDNSLEGESFLDVDFVFLTPVQTNICSFGKTMVSYKTRTWII